MDDTTQRIRALGARRTRLREELDATNKELRTLMPAANAVLSLESIRKLTGVSIATIRHWLQTSA
jgi:DNA-binding transcriptional MerR regulator